jgi:hypothetical protein
MSCTDTELLSLVVGCALVGDEELAVRALEARVTGRLRDEQLRPKGSVAMGALHVEHVALRSRLAHLTSVAVSAVRTEP